MSFLRSRSVSHKKLAFVRTRFAHRAAIGLLAIAILALQFAPLAQAATYFWDVDGAATPGFGTVVGGWDGTNVFWNSSSTGSTGGTTTAVTTSADDLIIPQATINTGAITLSGTQAASSITFAQTVGAVTILGGTSITIGGTGASSGIIDQSTAAEAISANLILNASTTTFSVSNSNAALLTIGAVTGAATTGTQTVAVSSSSTGGVTFNGIIGDGAGGGTVSLSVSGLGNGVSNGTTILSGANTYTGDTAVTFGKLTLGSGANGSLSSSSALKMSGGAFTYSRTGASQIVNGLTINAGAATVSNTVSGQTLTLGGITRTAAAFGVLNFATNTGGIITSTSNTNGIIGPWATFGTTTGLKYAVANGAAAITGLTGTTATAGTLVNVTDPAANYEYSVAATTAANLTGNTLRYSGAATATTIGSTNTLTLNGLMNAGTGALTISGGPTAGAIIIGSSNELVIAANAQGINISAVIKDGAAAGSVTYSGTGTLTLSGANKYSGATRVNSGIIAFGAIVLTGFGGGSARNIFVAPGAGVTRTALDNAFLARLVLTNSEITVGTGTGATNVDFSSGGGGAYLPNAFLGNFASNGAKAEYSGVITPADDAYRLGSPISSGLLGILKPLTDSTNSRSLLVGGNRVELVTANTFTGDTTIRAGGKLVIGNTLALQNSALNTGIVGDNLGGNFALQATFVSGNITGATAAPNPTLGGLKGNRNLNSMFTSTASNNETLLAATAVTGFILNTGAAANDVYSGVIADFASGTNITKTGTGTQVFTGVNTYTGTTAVNAGTLIVTGALTGSSTVAINSGTLTLDYGTTDTSKINDSAALTLGGGTLNLNGGTHTEIVGSTTLAAGTASKVTRGTGTASLQLGSISVGSAAVVDFGAAGIATTDNLNDATGILGTYATIAGADWAVNSTNSSTGPITAYTGYTDVQRLTPGVIADNSANNVRLIEGAGTAGNISLGAATTTINTLNQSTSGGTSAATIDLAGKLLATNGILVGPGAGGLTVGSGAGANVGTLMDAFAGGSLVLTNNSSNALTINSVIADNSFASNLTVSGTGVTVLTATNTYSGTTYIGSGTLQLGAGGTTGSLPPAGIIVNNGTLTFKRSDAIAQGTDFSSTAITGTGSLVQAGAGTTTLNVVNSYAGATTVSSGILALTAVGTVGATPNVTISSGDASLYRYDGRLDGDFRHN